MQPSLLLHRRARMASPTLFVPPSFLSRHYAPAFALPSLRSQQVSDYNEEPVSPASAGATAATAAATHITVIDGGASAASPACMVATATAERSAAAATVSISSKKRGGGQVAAVNRHPATAPALAIVL